MEYVGRGVVPSRRVSRFYVNCKLCRIVDAYGAFLDPAVMHDEVSRRPFRVGHLEGEAAADYRSGISRLPSGLGVPGGLFGSYLDLVAAEGRIDRLAVLYEAQDAGRYGVHVVADETRFQPGVRKRPV